MLEMFRAKGPGEVVLPLLYPSKTRKEEMATVLRALRRFVGRYGFWPRKCDLARRMRVGNEVLLFYLRELETAGLVRRIDDRHWAITEGGWHVLGNAPTRPWRKAPRSEKAHARKKIIIPTTYRVG